MPHLCADQPRGERRSLISRAPLRAAPLRCSFRLSRSPASACPASRRRPRTALDTGLVARDAPANSTSSSLSSPVDWARLRHERLAEMAGRAAGTMRCEKLRPAARHSGSASRSVTRRAATTRCPAPFRTSADPGHWLSHLGTATTPLPSGARDTSTATTALVRESRSRRVTPETLAGTRCPMDTAGGNGGARR